MQFCLVLEDVVLGIYIYSNMLKIKGYKMIYYIDTNEIKDAIALLILNKTDIRTEMMISSHLKWIFFLNRQPIGWAF